MFLLLMPLGMLLIGGAANGWAVLADLVFYIFFAASTRLHDGAADVCGQRKDGGRRGSEEARGDPEGIAAPEPAPAGRKALQTAVFPLTMSPLPMTVLPDRRL